MKIIVVSDSHGKEGVLEQVVKTHPDADAYLHCGDIEDYAESYPQYIIVQGNNDIFYDHPEQRIISLKNHRILMVHGHTFSYSRRLEEMAKAAIENNCDIVCYGHTHVAADETINGVRLLNPGSLRYSRDGRPPSYLVMTIDDTHVDVEFVFLQQKQRKFFW